MVLYYTLSLRSCSLSTKGQNNKLNLHPFEPIKLNFRYLNSSYFIYVQQQSYLLPLFMIIYYTQARARLLRRAWSYKRGDLVSVTN